MEQQKLTEDEIRLKYLLDNGWPTQEALDYIRQYPNAVMLGEKYAILAQRWKELGQALKRAWKGDK